jgi:simple sugar transport system permease protein
MTEWGQVPPLFAVIIALAAASCIGFLMGCMITFWNVPPFIATLAGMFFARGSCFLISLSSIPINNPTLRALALWKLRFGPVPRPGAQPAWFINLNVILAFVMVIAIIYISLHTKFGRNIYAVGGNEQSAMLMGIPVRRTKLLIYTVNGFCSGVAGLVFSLYMLSGYGLNSQGMEMDAIAAVVIGGTLLSGGVGYVYGSIFGVLTLGIIQALIMFNGQINSWWTKITVGILLLAFIGLQRLIVVLADRRKK